MDDLAEVFLAVIVALSGFLFSGLYKWMQNIKEEASKLGRIDESLSNIIGLFDNSPKLIELNKKFDEIKILLEHMSNKNDADKSLNEVKEVLENIRDILDELKNA